MKLKKRIQLRPPSC